MRWLHAHALHLSTPQRRSTARQCASSMWLLGISCLICHAWRTGHGEQATAPKKRPPNPCCSATRVCVRVLGCVLACRSFIEATAWRGCSRTATDPKHAGRAQRGAHPEVQGISVTAMMHVTARNALPAFKSCYTSLAMICGLLFRNAKDDSAMRLVCVHCMIQARPWANVRHWNTLFDMLIHYACA
jgi:hypothetical protein